MLEPYMNKDQIEVGLDEAGRGPLFGPVYTAAVVLPKDNTFNHELMRDSKKLNEKQRLEAYDYIKDHAIDWTSYWMSAEDVDKHNVFQATHKAMHKALDQLLNLKDY